MKDKKKRIDYLLLGVSLVLLLVIIGALVYIYDNTRIFKNTISDLSDKAITNINSINSNNIFSSDMSSIEGTLVYDGETYGIDFDYDKSSSAYSLGLSINIENPYKVYLVSLSNSLYLKTENLLNNIYKVDYEMPGNCESDCTSIQLSDVINNLTSNYSSSTSLLKDTISELKKTVNKSLKNKYVSKVKTETGYTYSYNLNKESLNIIVDNINKNTTLKDNLFTLLSNEFSYYNITKENFNTITDSLITEGYLTLNTDKDKNINQCILVLNDYVSLNIDIASNKITYEKIDDNYKFEYNYKDNIFDIYFNQEKSATIKFNEENILDIDITLYKDNQEIPCSIENTSNTDEDNVTRGTLKVNIDTYSFNIDYTLNDFSNFIDIDATENIELSNMSEEEMNKVTNAITEITNSKFVKVLQEILEKYSVKFEPQFDNEF